MVSNASFCVRILILYGYLILLNMAMISVEAKANPNRIPAEAQAFENVCNTIRLGYLSSCKDPLFHLIQLTDCQQEVLMHGIH